MRKLSNEEIVILLRIARTNYIYDIKNTSIQEGLCYYIIIAFHQIYDKYITCVDIPILISNFNPIFCKGNNTVYWWPIYDTESRIKALDALIKYYKHNAISYRIKFYFKLYCRKCSKIIK